MANLPTPGQPGARTEGQDLAPVYTLLVNDMEVQLDISQYIKSVHFESAMDMSDMLEIVIHNPGFQLLDPKNQPPDFTQHKAFQPGNEIELWGGYGKADRFIGRAIITRHMPTFPSEGIPTLTIKGYDKSYLLMHGSGGLSVDNNNRVALQNPRPSDVKDDQGTPFVNVTPANAIRKIAGKYGLTLDIDDTANDGTPLKKTSFLHRKGVTDYEICRMLANLNRKAMFVEYLQTKEMIELQAHRPPFSLKNPFQPGWVFHWNKPNTDDTPLYEFTYNTNDASLMSFSCEYGLKDQLTEVVVLMWDAHGQRWLSVVQTEDVEGENPSFKAGAGLQQQFKSIKGVVGNDGATITARSVSKKAKQQAKRAITGSPELMKSLGTATEFRLAAGGVAIDVQRNDQPFKTLEDVARWASRWLEAHKDNFLIAHGTVIGVETLRAGQVHTLSGLGPMLSGNYYFISVKHKFEVDSGYTCEFTARRIL